MPSYSLQVAFRLFYVESPTVTGSALSDCPPRSGRLSAFEAMLAGSLQQVSSENEALAVQGIKTLADTLATEAEHALDESHQARGQVGDLGAIGNHIRALWQEQASLRNLAPATEWTA